MMISLMDICPLYIDCINSGGSREVWNLMHCMQLGFHAKSHRFDSDEWVANRGRKVDYIGNVLREVSSLHTCIVIMQWFEQSEHVNC